MEKLCDHILQTLQLLEVMMEPPNSLSDATTAGTQLTDDSIYTCLSEIRQLVSEAVFLLTCKQYHVQSILLADKTGNTSIEFEELLKSRLHCETTSCDIGVHGDKQSIPAFIQPSTLNNNNQLAGGPVTVKRKRGRPRKATTSQAAVSSDYQETESFRLAEKLQSVTENIWNNARNFRRSCRSTAGSTYVQCKQSQNNDDGDKDVDTKRQQTLKTGDSSRGKVELKQPLCLMCGERFETLSECLDHWQASHIISTPHSGKLGVTCNHCPPFQNCLTLSSSEDDVDIVLEMSQWLHHALAVHGFTPPHDVLTEFHCSLPLCRFRTYFETELEEHSLRGQHQVGRARQNALSVCDRCGKMLRHTILSTHRKHCLQFSENPVACHHCTAPCGTKQTLRRHIKESHPEADVRLTKDYRCSCCDYMTGKRSSFTEHMYRLHGVNDAGCVVFVCSLCKFSTVKRSALIRHETRTHTNGRTLVCTHCSKAFKCIASLQAHMLVHDDYKDRRFPCSLCGYRAARKAHLLAHQDAQHGASTQLYSCELCGYCNGYAANISRHRRLFCKFRDKSTTSCNVVAPAGGATTNC